MHPTYGPIHPFWFSPFFFFFFSIFAVVQIIPYWFIFKKAGFSPWLSLLMFFPLISIIVLYVIAFSEWRVVPVTAVYPMPPNPGYPPAI